MTLKTDAVATKGIAVAVEEEPTKAVANVTLKRGAVAAKGIAVPAEDKTTEAVGKQLTSAPFINAEVAASMSFNEEDNGSDTSNPGSSTVKNKKAKLGASTLKIEKGCATHVIEEENSSQSHTGDVPIAAILLKMPNIVTPEKKGKPTEFRELCSAKLHFWPNKVQLFCVYLPQQFSIHTIKRVITRKPHLKQKFK